MNDVHAAKFGDGGMGNGEERAMFGRSERTATVALRIPSAEKFYLAVREEFSIQNMTRRLKAILTYLVASCSPNERLSEVLKRTGVYEMGTGSYIAVHGLQIEEEREGGRRAGVKVGALFSWVHETFLSDRNRSG